MTGTLINIAAILIGSTIGIVLGNRLQAKMQELVLQAVCMILLVMGVNMINESRNVMVPMVSIVLGALIGEQLGIDAFLYRLLARAESDWGLQVQRGKVAWNTPRAFMTASLVFCVGPMAIVGSIQDGLYGDYQLLTVKGVMEGLVAIPIAASMGPGVLLSAGTVGVVQGALSGLAKTVGSFLMVGSVFNPDALWVVELTATGGIMILCVALSLLEVKKIRVINLAPSLLISPVIVILLGTFGIPW
ncbi:MAG: DUF554 domain-containing protein [Caldilineaceae bacterium SB0670_bin_27]|uniref:DUF554 domain-containing protein n=1 Tax=Caldilineaceae bacterium SB0664_bin_27 TaxID=2605260 RepID=A0A6B0YWR0_9CHLR|nr:DUF554 domain-containing protein [Caldilineaceae bacterium]MDE0340224.1 DUF554 domain-containing protein [Caldilineaceae bacterium]MXY95093.1 DUF554 domain-containing protein [Caldilineaceae bacterium SB0664_bin_27]MYJ77776.1 DUF554 domain-containing protein [Caldilineaceae bacterium SB0670_bin_27]